MNILYGLLSVVILLDSILLILLVLIQLPKKEAGIGQAFGGATTDALFGSGSGNALTKLTKYATGVFFATALVMLVINTQRNRGEGGRLREEMRNTSSRNVALPATNTQPARGPILTSIPTNSNLTLTNPMAGTNTPAPNTRPQNSPAPAPAPGNK